MKTKLKEKLKEMDDLDTWTLEKIKTYYALLILTKNADFRCAIIINRMKVLNKIIDL